MMTDIVDRATRSRMMSGIGGKNTKPELLIRSGLHGQGFRYRLHHSGLPGKPDLVFASRRAVIFVNGCFWHGHRCHLFKWPSTRQQWWRDKINGTRRRDRTALGRLVADDWRVLTIWECALKGPGRQSLAQVISQTARWLDGKKPVHEITGKVV
jgi:DNA mismatch endonuclease (patch repair protein)